jgi:anti-sigma28 factor (negative regulator of flagellin synthesis)
MKKQISVREKTTDQRPPKRLLKTLWRSCQSSEARQEKIKSLSHTIHTNGYRIDCRKLADCLITSLLFGLLR